MADRAFERMFAEAAAQEAAAEAERDRRRPDSKGAKEDEEAKLRRATEAMTAADAIKRILLAWKDQDLFRLLQLPQPEADALGRPAWSGEPADVSKAYRRMSVLVHPDKFAGQDEKLPEAREAFEALNEAHRRLREPGTLEQELAKQADAARARRQKREAEASLEERVVLNAQQKEAARELKKQEGESFQKKLREQQKARLDAARRQAAATAKARVRDADGNEEAGEEEENGERAAEQEGQKRKEAEDAEGGDEAAAAARRRQNAAKRRRMKQQQQV